VEVLADIRLFLNEEIEQNRRWRSFLLGRLEKTGTMLSDRMPITTYKNSVFIRFKNGQKHKPHIWFIHGFGASSDSFREAFELKYLREYIMFAPDFPGFGSSLGIRNPHNIKQSAELLRKLIRKFSPRNPVILVAHSLGGLIATKVALSLGKGIAGYVNVEGNFTSADCFFSGKAAKARNPIKWKESFRQKLYKSGLKDKSLRRYWLSFSMASPSALNRWGKSGVKETGEELGGINFLKVNCPKIYIYGDKSIPKKTKTFIVKHKIDSIKFRNCGHFVMGDATQLFYKTIAEFVSACEKITCK
jgi:pimeloyl-ACP methyl ester carboxylesterase